MCASCVTLPTGFWQTAYHVVCTLDMSFLSDSFTFGIWTFVLIYLFFHRKNGLKKKKKMNKWILRYERWWWNLKCFLLSHGWESKKSIWFLRTKKRSLIFKVYLQHRNCAKMEIAKFHLMLLLRFNRGLCAYVESRCIILCARAVAGEPMPTLSTVSPSDRRLVAVLLCFNHMA